MLTEKDFNSVLIDSMKKQHINILVSFANSFLREFGSVITKDELLKRINKLKYIGFKRPGKYDVVGSADAMYVSSEQVIIISDKNKDKEEKIIKSILYHELIHAVSYHKEKNLDSSINQYEFYRTGLDRQYVEFNTSSDKPGFREGELLEEIMTEYYSTVLLKKEEIDFKGIYVLESYCFDEDYVEYHGAGYQNIAALGQIYDFLFGEELLKAKLYDGNDFRMKFNNMFDSLDVFAHCFTDEGFKVPSYSKFVAQRSVMDRYESACKMFVEIFKKKYGANINSISDLFKNEEFNTFLNMLVKTRNRFVSESKINENLYLLTKKLEKDLAICLFGNEINDNEYGINTSDIETSLYIVINKIYNKNNNVDLNSIKYAVFHDEHFNGIYLIIDDEKYIINYRTLGQNIDYVKLKKFSEFSNEEIDTYSKAYKMNISSAEFANFYSNSVITTFIVKDNKLYNYHGNEIIIEKFNNYSVNIVNKKQNML